MKCSFAALPASTFVQRKNNKKSHRASWTLWGFFFPPSPPFEEEAKQPLIHCLFYCHVPLKDYSNHLLSLHEKTSSFFLSWLRKFLSGFSWIVIVKKKKKRISDSAAEEIFRGAFFFLKFTVLGVFQLSRFPLPRRFLFLVRCQFPFSSQSNKANPWLGPLWCYFTHGCIYVIQILHFPLVMTSDPEEWLGKQSNRSQK